MVVYLLSGRLRQKIQLAFIDIGGEGSGGGVKPIIHFLLGWLLRQGEPRRNQ